MSKIEESLETKKKKEYQEGGIEWQTSKGGGGWDKYTFCFSLTALPAYYFLRLRLFLIQGSVLSQIIKNFNLKANIDIWIKRLGR